MRRIFIWGVCVFVLTAAILLSDIRFGFSLNFWWMDNVEHLLGGVLAGLIGLWWGIALTNRATRAQAIIGAIILGALVEIVEYALGWGVSAHMSRILDTSKDMIIDVIGGWIAWRLARRTV